VLSNLVSPQCYFGTSIYYCAGYLAPLRRKFAILFEQVDMCFGHIVSWHELGN